MCLLCVVGTQNWIFDHQDCIGNTQAMTVISFRTDHVIWYSTWWQGTVKDSPLLKSTWFLETLVYSPWQVVGFEPKPPRRLVNRRPMNDASAEARDVTSNTDHEGLDDDGRSRKHRSSRHRYASTTTMWHNKLRTCVDYKCAWLMKTIISGKLYVLYFEPV